MENSLSDFEQNRIVQKSVKHLWTAGKIIQDISPELSRFYVHQGQSISRSNQIAVSKNQEVCQQCGTFWSLKTPNYHARLKPRPVLNKKLKGLYHTYQTSPQSLTKRERKRIVQLVEKSNKMVYHCGVCRQKSVYSGKKKPARPLVSPGTVHLTPKTPSGLTTKGTSVSNSSQKKRRSLLQKVLEKESVRTPASTSKSSLRNFLRSV